MVQNSLLSAVGVTLNLSSVDEENSFSLQTSLFLVSLMRNTGITHVYVTTTCNKHSPVNDNLIYKFPFSSQYKVYFRKHLNKKEKKILQMIYFILSLVIATLDVSYTANVLIWNPTIGHSHVRFMGNIADILIKDGHNVVSSVLLQ